MGFINYIIGAILLIVGMFASVTIIGAIIGIPMMLIGAYLLYRERMKSSQKIIRDGIAEGLRQASVTGSTSVHPLSSSIAEGMNKTKETSLTNVESISDRDTTVEELRKT